MRSLVQSVFKAAQKKIDSQNLTPAELDALADSIIEASKRDGYSPTYCEYPCLSKRQLKTRRAREVNLDFVETLLEKGH